MPATCSTRLPADSPRPARGVVSTPPTQRSRDGSASPTSGTRPPPPEGFRRGVTRALCRLSTSTAATGLRCVATRAWCAAGGAHRRQGSAVQLVGLWCRLCAHGRQVASLSLRSPLTPSRPARGLAPSGATHQSVAPARANQHGGSAVFDSGDDTHDDDTTSGPADYCPACGYSIDPCTGRCECDRGER